MSVHEYAIHGYVSELLEIFGARSDDLPADKYVDILKANMIPYVTTAVSMHHSKKCIAETTKTPHEFLKKYDELKMKNIRDVDVVTHFFSKLLEDEQAKNFLEANALQRAAQSGISLGATTGALGQLQVAAARSAAGVSSMNQQELAELRSKLLKSTTSDYLPSDVMAKIMQSKQKRDNVNIPFQPDWLFDRPFLTLDFVVGDSPEMQQVAVELGVLPLPLQEHSVIEDLLYCLQGVDGKYIIAQKLTERYGTRNFAIDNSLDTALKELVVRILPLAANYSTVARFIEEKDAFEHGLVNQALAAAMRSLIKEYYILIAQLEHLFRLGQLSLQKIWFYIQPTMSLMEILASVANSINKGNCAGAAVLSLLHERTTALTGDSKAQDVCLYLTQSACVPYLEILEKWIYKGIIGDPYHEFMIVENETLQKELEEYDDANWEQHYTVYRERTPLFLEGVSQKILNTGKYLNVVRLCDVDIRSPGAKEVVYTVKERHYVDQIEMAHTYASKLLLDLLIDKVDLLPRLRSMKHYFLLDQGDFIVQFMDMAEEEMKKHMEEIMPQRLESLLELALRTSTAANDPYKDDLRVELLPYDLITQLFKILTIETAFEKDFRIDPTDLHLSGLEAFSFNYIVKWPLSLVLNKKTMFRYQMLFRHLFYTKHVERQVCNVWLSNKSAKRCSLHSVRWYAPAFALRQRMLHFVQHFQYYMMFEVVNSYWHEFEARMQDVSNVDDVLRLHTGFLNNCLKDCMLTNPDLLRIVHKLMMVCVTFSNFMQRVYKASSIEQEASPLTMASTLQALPVRRDAERHAAAVKGVVASHVEMEGSDDYESTIATFDGNFSKLLVSLLSSITELSLSNSSDHKLMNLVYRLDFNSFYSSRIEAAVIERSSSRVSGSPTGS